MRLTLRTLLAFMDGHLKPEDAELLGTKIQQSATAQRMQQHINILRQRNLLSAPKTSLEGLGDANTVAQYLDSTIDPEQVAAFEKLCLESDIHLAEVSETHQMLVSSADEAEPVSPELRQRIYGLAKPDDHVSESQSQTELAEESHSQIYEDFVDFGEDQSTYHTDVFALAPPSTDYEASEETEDIPAAKPAAKGDQPRNRKRIRVLPLLITITCLLLLTLLIIWANREKSNNQVSTSRNPSEAQDQDPNLSTVKSDGTKLNKSDGANSTASFLKTKLDERKAQTPLRDSQATFVEKPVDDEPPANLDAADLSQARPNTGSAADAPGPGMNADESKVVEANFNSIPDSDDNPQASTASDSEMSDEQLFEFNLQPGGASVAEVLENGQLVARLDKSKNWMAMTATDTLKEHEFVLALPFYRPTFVFKSAQLTVCGAGSFSALPVNAQGVAGVSLHAGRYLLRANAEKFSEFLVKAGNVNATLTLHNSQSAVAIEVKHFFPNGSDPVKMFSQRKTAVTVTGISGTSTWVDQRDVLKIEPDLAKSYLTGDDPRLSRERHLRWANGVAEDEFENADRAFVFKAAMAGKDLRTNLESVFKSDSINETTRGKLLIELCLLHLGDSSKLVEILSQNTPTHTRLWVWRTAIALARENLNRSLTSATAFQAQLVAKPDGLAIYRVLRRFSNDQLTIGADASLVDLLSHASQALRVLAHQELWDITGESRLFRPETIERLRSRQVESWKGCLAEKQIRYQAE